MTQPTHQRPAVGNLHADRKKLPRAALFAVVGSFLIAAALFLRFFGEDANPSRLRRLSQLREIAMTMERLGQPPARFRHGSVRMRAFDRLRNEWAETSAQFEAAITRSSFEAVFNVDATSVRDEVGDLLHLNWARREYSEGYHHQGWLVRQRSAPLTDVSRLHQMSDGNPRLRGLQVPSPVRLITQVWDKPVSLLVENLADRGVLLDVVDLDNDREEVIFTCVVDPVIATVASPDFGYGAPVGGRSATGIGKSTVWRETYRLVVDNNKQVIEEVACSVVPIERSGEAIATAARERWWASHAMTWEPDASGFRPWTSRHVLRARGVDDLFETEITLSEPARMPGKYNRAYPMALMMVLLDNDHLTMMSHVELPDGRVRAREVKFVATADDEGYRAYEMLGSLPSEGVTDAPDPMALVRASGVHVFSGARTTHLGRRSYDSVDRPQFANYVEWERAMEWIEERGTPSTITGTPPAP